MANPDPILTQPATARRLSSGLPAGIRMLQALGLNRHEQAGLLGLSPRSLERAAHPSAAVLSQDQLARLSITIGIYNALHLLYDANTAAGWLQRANQRPLLAVRRRWTTCAAAAFQRWTRRAGCSPATRAGCSR